MAWFNWDKSLHMFMVLSGSVHLGLFAFLMTLSKAQPSQSQSVDVDLIEHFNPESSPVEKAIAAPRPPVQKTLGQTQPAEQAPSQNMVSETVASSDSEKAIDLPSESSTEMSGGSSQGREAVTAQERYIAGLTRLLNSKKKYPEMARKLRQQGRVVLKFRLAADGSVMEASITSPSSHKLLNQSAESLIQSLKGLEPFPNEIKKTTWLFTVPIDYQM